ncbi:putative F-box domain-containing protein [Colletotrichum sublineola]|uniref:Putative F-box domain-containing protein n=1 Tax=Colletotrichum sublineola TaxID=1173701 RepID=A0A066XA53_COLSU|nr:putative F-box domain-containing protein [Colletotrichum sublineola]
MTGPTETPAGPTPMEVVDEQGPGLSTSATKTKGRHRVLCGVQRIPSSPSLSRAGRTRSHSSPQRGRGNVSCVSLAGPSTSASSFGGDSYFPAGLTASGYASASASSSVPGTPSSETVQFMGIDGRLAIRRVDNVFPMSQSPGHQTVGLPSDMKTSRIQIANPAVPKRGFNFWESMPHEIRVHIFSYLTPKELVRASCVSKMFHKICFDGQLWTSFDATEFYQIIPAESLARIIVAAGPFIKDLNLRGCVQVEHYKRAEVVVKACKNLVNATLEGCRNFQRNTLHSLLRSNDQLANLNLTGLTAVTNMSCKIIAESCPQLETFNVSWAGEVRGFDNLEVADTIYETNNLERLVLNGCAELNDRALKIMVHGEDPEIDILTDLPIVPPRKWRHLDLSRCSRLTTQGVKALGYNVPDLQGLRLSGCTALTDAALEPILASTPHLTHLEMEDLAELTNSLLSEHLAKAPCAQWLEHLSISYCENLGDSGVLPVVKNCISLRSMELDNTRISDLVLAEAAYMVSNRSQSTAAKPKPRVGLHMVVYDCQNVTWTGIREVLFRNAQTKPSMSETGKFTYSAEAVSLKCFYKFQMTVDEHMKRVLRGDLAAANRLERRWADYMQATEEAGTAGAGHRRRRRRAREAQILHADEEEGGNAGRRRGRTVGSCTIM